MRPHVDCAPPRREVRTLNDTDRIARVLAVHPDLAGFGWRTHLHDQATFTRSREELHDAVPEFNRALAFLRAADHIYPASSYALKHAAERRHRERHQVADAYVSNGAMIAAALALGFRCVRIADTPNSIIRG